MLINITYFGLSSTNISQRKNGIEMRTLVAIFVKMPAEGFTPTDYMARRKKSFSCFPFQSNLTFTPQSFSLWEREPTKGWKNLLWGTHLLVTTGNNLSPKVRDCCTGLPWDILQKPVTASSLLRGMKRTVSGWHCYEKKDNTHSC